MTIRFLLSFWFSIFATDSSCAACSAHVYFTRLHENAVAAQQSNMLRICYDRKLYTAIIRAVKPLLFDSPWAVCRVLATRGITLDIHSSPQPYWNIYIFGYDASRGRY